jgi:hypothetical protein
MEIIDFKCNNCFDTGEVYDGKKYIKCDCDLVKQEEITIFDTDLTNEEDE